MGIDVKRTSEFLSLVKDFQFTDLIAFGNILGVQEKEDFTEFVQDLMVKFNQEGRLRRKQLLKLAKDVAKANKDLGFIKENGEKK